MLTKLDGRNVCPCRQAAEILGVTPGRVRHMVMRKQVWSSHVTERALVLDRDEIEALGKARDAARAAGHLRGTRGQGFVAN